MVAFAAPVTRGCGTRVAGGIYADIGVGPGGTPIEEFLIDTRPVDLAALGITSIGVKLITDSRGVTHVFDLVGRDSYPNVADWVEEARRFGISRRIPQNLDVSRLTADSRIVLLHRRAWIENPRQLLPLAWPTCRTGRDEHRLTTEHCIRDWWETVEGGELVPTGGVLDEVVRTLPSCAYTARAPAPGVSYAPGYVASLPIPHLVVVHGAHSDELRDRLAQSTALPVEEVAQ
jgi:hypothetical protein